MFSTKAILMIIRSALIGFCIGIVGATSISDWGTKSFYTLLAATVILMVVFVLNLVGDYQ